MSFGGYMVIASVAQLPTWVPQTSANFQEKNTVTANPATDVITCAVAHDQIASEVVMFTTTGTLPAPLVPFRIYRVVGTITSTTFQVSDNATWPTIVIIDLTDTGSGVHTLWTRPFEIVGTIANVDTVNEIITSSTRTFFHSDVTESDRVRFSGSLPSPLVANTDYWVAYNPTDKTFKVAIGGGGGTIVNLTTGTLGGNILSIRGTTTVQYPTGLLGVYGLDSAYMFGDTSIQIIGGGGGAGESQGAESNIVEVPRPTIRVRDPELASLIRRARRASRTIENLTIIGASGDSESGFSL